MMQRTNFVTTLGPACVVAFAFLHLAASWSSVGRAEESHIAEAPPLTPQEQLKRFHLPPGFEIQLVAAEPDIQKPMNFNFDSAGRLWFTGSVEYPYPKPETMKGRDTVRIIHGFNPDGSATKITTFADDLNIPIGITPIGTSQAIVFSIPNVYRLTDANNDGMAEKRDVMFGPFGYRDTHGMNNGFTRGIDGWIYACHGYVNSSPVQGTDGQQIALEGGAIYRFRPDGSHIEFFTHGQVNPFGLTFDRLGNLYSADCHTQPAYLLLRGAWYPNFGKPHDGLGFGPQIMSHLHGSTGIAGIVCYEAEQFPDEYRGNLFIGNPITHRVNRDKLVFHGSSPEAVEQPDFLTCDDPWFRPVEVKLGLDGALYIGDFYNCIIGHYEVPLDHPKRDRERGRIWRIVYKGDATTTPNQETRPSIANADAGDLIAALADSNIAVRTLATNELVERIGPSCTSLVRSRLEDNGSAAEQRAHSLWVLERLGALGDDQVRRLLSDKAGIVRTQMVKALADRAPASISPTLVTLVRSKLTDDDAFVRRAAADCLSRHPDPAGVKPLLDLWQATPSDDVQLIHTVRMSLRDHLKLPSVMSALRDRDHGLALNEEQHARLAELCLGIPTITAADLALDYLMQRPNAVRDSGDAMYPLVRYVSAERLSDVYILALKYRDRPRARKSDARADAGQEQVVLVGLYRAARERGIELSEPITSWGKQFATAKLSSHLGSQRMLGIELAREMNLREAHTCIAEIAVDDVGSDVRLDALLACVALDGAASVDLLDRTMHSSAEELALRQRAARLLGTINTDAARESLLRFLPTAPERLAVEISASLAKTKPGGEALLEAVATGKASRQLLQESLVAEPLGRLDIHDLPNRIKALTEGMPSRDEQLRRLIEDRVTGFNKVAPDVDRGRQIFTKNCAVCHKLGGEGAKIGPELDGVGVRGPARLMEDLLDPNRNIDQAFRATVLTTTDGVMLSGLKLHNDGQLLVLADSAGKEQKIPVADIEPGTLQVSFISPMPSNIRDLISEAEFYDLIGYLLQQRPDFKY